MGQTVHIIPVGFDFQRLAQPITKGELKADQVILLHSSGESSDQEAQRLAERMVERLEETLGTLFGKAVTRKPVEEIFDFEEAYLRAYEMIQEELDKENEVWINISSMPRTVAFAFASAANSIVVEEPDKRDDVHTYYVSTQQYLVTEMIRELRNEVEFLQELSEKHGDDETVEERLKTMQELASDVQENGTTKGADQVIELPTIPIGELHQFEKELLRFLREHGTQESISALASSMANEQGNEIDHESYKSKVQYNVSNLEKAGFIERTPIKNKHQISLDTMGKLWVETHRE